jgi:hypothetical protein
MPTSIIKYKNYDKMPEPRADALVFLENDYLYIVGGYAENNKTNLTTGLSKKLLDIWKLNLKTKEWNYLGEINNQELLIYKNCGYMVNNSCFYDYGKLCQLDFKNNKIKLSEPKDKYTFSTLERFNPKTKELFYILGNSDESNKKYEVIVEDFENYKNGFTNEVELFKTHNSYLLYILILLTFFVSSVLFYFLKKKKNSTYVNKIILKESNFYYKDKSINNLSSEENDLLHFFFKCKNSPLPMNEVVDFFSKNDNTPYNTLTKKKDMVLNGLKQKLAFILEVDEDDLFITQKNTEDKRIKEIQLNPRYFID